ncbi:uncharacterized protein RCC_09848 [Ramularia collo-cygni]|uniref:Uncharacterized protein n=1 Tax=Ramularia collo-cygni TaxID=112498 RepID=A0A2D3VIJ6_9PEZI|nr:uncharacterized protein RCC_09848 [Ramularia collo-cygni]CZT24131.1 uncharacterized protein RCC_09848 [Ramularia collo-cygni]
MARLNLAAKASQAKIIFPRLVAKDQSHHSYISFLKSTFEAGQQNKIAIGLAEKQKVDDEFRSQLVQLYGHDDKFCKTQLQELNSPASMALWKGFKARSGPLVKTASSMLLSSETDELTLPAVGRSVKGENDKGDSWNFQTYEEFAKKTEKMNRNTVFTKKLMDDSFQKAISLVVSKTRTRGGRTAQNIGAVNKMLNRCLGSESDKYWEGR